MTDEKELKTNIESQMGLQLETTTNEEENQFELKIVGLPKSNMTYISIEQDDDDAGHDDEHDENDIDDEKYDIWYSDIWYVGEIWYVGDTGYERLHYQLTNYFEKTKETFWKCEMINDPRNKDFYNEWPSIVYISPDQCKQVPFINPQSTYFKSLSIYIPHEGYVFYFGDIDDELVYIINKKIQNEIYECLRIIDLNNDINNEYPDCIYLTKEQCNHSKQLLGLDLLKKRAIFDKQKQEEINKLNDHVKRKEKMNLLRSKYIGFTFIVDGRSQLVYYVDDIRARGIDIRFVCMLSNKNGVDKLDADLPYEPVIVLNENEIKELEENNSFTGKGQRLYFDEDIYSLYASFFFSNKNPSYYLCGVAIFTFLLQLISFLAILWCFDVSYTEDVIKEYIIGQSQQCDVETTIFTNYNNTNDTEITTGCITLIENDAYTQRFEDPQHWWYIAGYGGTAFVSVLILTCYVYKAMISPLKLFVSTQYVDVWKKKNQKNSIRCLLIANSFLILSAYSIGCRSIITYPKNIGLETPFDALASPIGIVFVLELDDWIYHVMKIAYCEHIELNGFVEVTAAGLADFGTRSSKFIHILMICQLGAACSAIFAALGTKSNSSDDVSKIESPVHFAILAFVIIVEVVVATVMIRRFSNFKKKN